VVIGTGCIGSCKSNYHTITATIWHVPEDTIYVMMWTMMWGDMKAEINTSSWIVLCTMTKKSLVNSKVKWYVNIKSFRINGYISQERKEVLNGVRVAQSLAFCVVFCRSFYFGNCIVCPSSYGFQLPLWYLQTLFEQDDYVCKTQLNNNH
jgi:hypothetical protein